MDLCLSQGHKYKVKYKQLYPRFELWLLIPFPPLISITSQVLPGVVSQKGERRHLLIIVENKVGAYVTVVVYNNYQTALARISS